MQFAKHESNTYLRLVGLVRPPGRDRAGMFTIEMLEMNWMDREHVKVVQRVPSEAKRLVDVNMIAKSLLDHAKGGANAYRIMDEDGVVVLRSWERAL